MAERQHGVVKATAAAVAARATASAPASRPGGRSSAGASRDREQRIRERAYAFFVERGCAEGHELDDWLRAEAEVGQHDAASPARAGVKS